MTLSEVVQEIELCKWLEAVYFDKSYAFTDNYVKMRLKISRKEPP